MADRPHRHAGLAFEIAPPAGFEVEEDLEDVALLARATASPRGFHPNLVVTVEPVDPRADVAAYTDASLDVQARALAAWRLIDRAAATLAGGPGTRTLGHHVVDEHAVTLEQWRLTAGGRGYTVSASCATLDYPALADELSAAAESLRPVHGEAP